MYRTQNDIAEETREKLIEILNRRLADAIDLQLQGKQAHWNVKGPNFIGLHKLFDEIVEEVAEGAVGGRAPALCQSFLCASRCVVPQRLLPHHF